MNNLRCIDVTKSFGGVHALVGVSVKFPPSGVVSIIGPNGAGKTTLINIISGFMKADSGSCFLGTQEITNLPPHSRVKLGISRTFQDVRLIYSQTVLNNVLLAVPQQRGENIGKALFPCFYYREEKNNKTQAYKLLNYMGLQDKLHVQTKDLSYGQQKLLSIVCCLASNTKIILLDEPVSGIHPEMVTKIVEVLICLSKEGKLIIVIEHNMEVVLKISDIVVVMDKGKVVAQELPKDVFANPSLINAYYS